MSIQTKRTFDEFESPFEVVVHVNICDTSDEEAAGLEDIGPYSIVLDFGWGRVCDSIDLDDQLAVKRDEIDDIPVDRVLASEFPACQPAIT